MLLLPLVVHTVARSIKTAATIQVRPQKADSMADMADMGPRWQYKHTQSRHEPVGREQSSNNNRGHHHNNGASEHKQTEAKKERKQRKKNPPATKTNGAYKLDGIFNLSGMLQELEQKQAEPERERDKPVNAKNVYM